MSENHRKFISESNAIEGILREPLPSEIEAFAKFMESDATLDDLFELQMVFAPNKPLRSKSGMDVRVGSHIAPRGGVVIADMLVDVIQAARESANPWRVHCDFESLHPFMDGNGRTGRALWAWQMQRLGLRPFALPFLHRFYYQTLDNADERRVRDV